MTEATLVDCIDALLPQTQCTKCGYDGCRPYAEAIAAGQARIDQCPPGGTVGITRLAALLEQPILPLNPKHGVEKPLTVAVIDERLCIGCTLCIQACPVDAIVGAAKLMHTVLAAQCTGCDLCLPPCPMDCIAMVEVDPPRSWAQADADAARARFRSRNARLARESSQQHERLQSQAPSKLDESDARNNRESIARKKAIVQAAIDRARARRRASSSSNR
jgi:electron transport complex protein RnfB